MMPTVTVGGEPCVSILASHALGLQGRRNGKLNVRRTLDAVSDVRADGGPRLLRHPLAGQRLGHGPPDTAFSSLARRAHIRPEILLPLAALDRLDAVYREEGRGLPHHGKP